jgi:hypothetical protein
MLKGKTYRTKVNLYLDVALAAAFLVALKPFVTGLPFHEWLGLGIGAALVVHAVAHRQWIVGITKQLFRKLPVKTHVYYALDATLLIAFATIIVSGVMMSTAVLPLLGVQSIVGLAVAQVHRLASYLTLALLAVKLVLHRTWIKNAIRRHVKSVPVAQKPAFQSPALAPVAATSENAAKIISRRRFLLIGCSAVGIALLASINKNQQAQGDPVTTPTGVLSGVLSDVLSDVLSGDTTSTAADAPVTDASVPPTAVAEATEPAATPTAVPTVVVVPQRVTTRCPHGMVSDPYPGRCHRYVDKNGNGICDLSETA